MQGFLRGVSSLFEDTYPCARTDRRTLVLLAVIVLVGAFVRFWGLGNVGLHGDEKTMALPAMHLVQYGTAQMPSGFLYPRAIAQLYFMAGSVLAFGRSAWALRLPSAICGVLLIVLAWLAGRRFLEPRWNLAMTAAVALLPAFIQDAQTARMYVFLVAGVTGFMALIFAWERSGRTGYLIGAVIEMAVSLQFHTLCIFAAWLCFLPGLLSGERRTPQVQSRLLWQGAAAFIAIVVEFLALNHWMGTEYPHSLGSVVGTPVNGPRAVAPPLHVLWPLAMILPALALSWFAIGARGRWPAFLMAASLVAQASRLDHIALLLIVAALVLARRDGKLPAARLGLYFSVCLLLAGAQLADLLAHKAGTVAQSLGLLLGWPSVRAFFALASYSAAALLIAVCGIAAALWRLAHRERIPDWMLFLALGVWIPLLQIGYFRWNPAQRYVEGQIMPLLLVTFAAGQWVWAMLSSRMSSSQAVADPGGGAPRPALLAGRRPPGPARPPATDSAATLREATHHGH